MAGRKKKKKQDVSNSAMVYRIYPTAEQKVFFAKTFGCCRKVWNLMLGDKINHYKEHKEMLDVSPAMYKKEYDYLKEVDSLALANVQQHLNEAYQRFFKKKARFPKFKKKGICKISIRKDVKDEIRRIYKSFEIRYKCESFTKIYTCR